MIFMNLPGGLGYKGDKHTLNFYGSAINQKIRYA